MMVLRQTPFWITLLFSVSFQVAETTSGIRTKRVLYGIPATAKDRGAYLSIRYYVFLAKGSSPGAIPDEPAWLQRFFKIGLSPTPAVQKCGGSLLTPSIVQTACHCLSTWKTRSEATKPAYAQPYNVWEDRIFSFFGSPDIYKLYYAIAPKHYIIYQACRKISNEANVFDFGLVVMKHSVDKKFPKIKLSYAPAYTADDIKQFYYNAIAKEYTCLFIGFGRWEVLFTVDDIPEVDRTGSEDLRWGWRTVMNGMDCYSVSYPPDHRKEFFFNYSEEATWVCAQAFSFKYKFHYLVQPGDSGGPVSCNEAYFAVVSFQSAFRLDNIISFAGAIAYTSYENAAEYRDDLIRFCNEYDNPDIPDPHHDDPDLVPTPMSQCPPKIVLYHLVISFSSVITFIFYPICIFSLI